MNLEKEIQALSAALAQNLEVIKVLSDRVSLLEDKARDNEEQRLALTLLLLAVVQTSPHPDQILLVVERLTAQMQAQPVVVLGDAKEQFGQVKKHLDRMISAIRHR